jgi:hypothetical protein
MKQLPFLEFGLSAGCSRRGPLDGRAAGRARQFSREWLEVLVLVLGKGEGEGEQDYSRMFRNGKKLRPSLMRTISASMRTTSLLLDGRDLLGIDGQPP